MKLWPETLPNSSLFFLDTKQVPLDLDLKSEEDVEPETDAEESTEVEAL